MSRGTEEHQAEAPNHTAVLEELKDQLLIALMKRLGGVVDIPVSEIDATQGDVLAFCVRGGVFHFEVGKIN